MAHDDEVLITYGLGYAFERSKLLIISEVEEKVVSKKEVNIMEEINIVNKFKEKLDSKCALKFPKSYLTNVEEALEEKVSKTIPIITSIKAKDVDKQNHLMDEYVKKDLSQMRLRKEGYIQKDSTLIKEYLDSCSENTYAKNIKEKSLKYNKMILKIILTSSFGDEFGDFLSKRGQATILEEIDKNVGERLENLLKKDYLIKKKYSELDFLNMLLFLEEWQRKYFKWDGKYTDLMFSINKDGRKYKGRKDEIKDSVISFIKEKRYLYLPFGKYNDDNIFINLSDERYCNMNENDEKRSQYVILEKKETNLYEIVSNEYKKIDLEENSELGYLLCYDNDTVYISFVVYDKKHEKVICKYNNKFTAFKSKMIEELEKHFIL
ncbi:MULTISPECIES: hypothetical protein [Clostridium]|jgi:hypothetical protein|uniref:Uncharacterized protein n=1 Tax=Clostridium beijerinckii TaxID=1520 RepID=A0AAW3WBH9_CLOBE|nr:MULTISPECIES: hypothetical protein [Clostridium]ALB47776.1 hypothetical protein X276_22145 [Clostridium beijerinckii NRRL B-598]MBC2458663.1 hypothetical protein [Clostridium beijerinckii]MBC2476121.1 hypothetical protein [Clostridium beijerinckii]MCI1477307.1 hypothetical protein [Clostridium beijerinckii]MCI1577072.1 hypothetical protein [Clostridium beijerinckii]